MDDWVKFKMKHHYLKNFYSHVNVGDIADTDYAHAKRVCKDFKIKKIRTISRFIYSKQYIVVSLCIGEL